MIVNFLLYRTLFPTLCELYNKNTIVYVVYKQLRFISHSSGDRDVQDQDTGIHGVWQVGELKLGH